MAAAIVMLEMISLPSTSFNIECQKNLNFKILINFGFGAFHESGIGFELDLISIGNWSHGGISGSPISCPKKIDSRSNEVFNFKSRWPRSGSRSSFNHLMKSDWLGSIFVAALQRTIFLRLLGE